MSKPKKTIVVTNKWITTVQFVKKPYSKLNIYNNVTPSSQTRLLAVLGDYPRETLRYGVTHWRIDMGKKIVAPEPPRRVDDERPGFFQPWNFMTGLSAWERGGYERE